MVSQQFSHTITDEAAATTATRVLAGTVWKNYTAEALDLTELVKVHILLYGCYYRPSSSYNIINRSTFI